MEESPSKSIAEDEIDRLVRSDFVNAYTEGYVHVGPDDTFLPMYYTKYADSIKNFPVQDSDVFVAAYLKTGSTWTQEMVWLIMNNCDFEGAKVDVYERFPMLEICTMMNYKKMNKETGYVRPLHLSDSIEFVKNRPSPRCIKTHLPFSLLPQEIQNGTKMPKIIYVMRNPKDVCVSYFHHGNILQGWRASFENFCKVFLAEKIMYGSFWKHVLSYWKHRTLSNLLIVTYEDLKTDLPTVIRKVATFLNKDVSDQQMESLVKHLSFESMKNNKAVNFEDVLEKIRKDMVCKNGAFIRSGIIGKHKEEMSPEMIEQFDAWTKLNLAGTGFDKDYGYIL